jgi:hypothetical protein
MSALSASHPDDRRRAPTPALGRRIAIVRAALALAWAAALVIAVGHRVPSTHSDLPAAVAAVLASYPAIDAVASLIGGPAVGGSSVRLLRMNAAISAAAVVALAVAAFGGDARGALVVFGAWAAVSGAVQLFTAIRGGGVFGRRAPMIVSGGLSVLAGIGFVAMSDDMAAHLRNLAGYMALGAVLYLVGALRRGAAA